jgi:hypothetical protein
MNFAGWSKRMTLGPEPRDPQCSAGGPAATLKANPDGPDYFATTPEEKLGAWAGESSGCCSTCGRMVCHPQCPSDRTMWS